MSSRSIDSIGIPMHARSPSSNEISHMQIPNKIAPDLHVQKNLLTQTRSKYYTGYDLRCWQQLWKQMYLWRALSYELWNFLKHRLVHFFHFLFERMPTPLRARERGLATTKNTCFETKYWSACHIRRLQLKAHARFCEEYRLVKIGSWLLENDKKSFGFSLGSLCSFEENLRNKLCAPIVKKEHDNKDIHNLSLIFVGFVADFNFVVIIISLAIDWV